MINNTSGIHQVSGDFKNCSGRYALVAGQFNHFITEKLVQGAVDALNESLETEEETLRILQKSLDDKRNSLSAANKSAVELKTKLDSIEKQVSGAGKFVVFFSHVQRLRHGALNLLVEPVINAFANETGRHHEKQHCWHQRKCDERSNEF